MRNALQHDASGRRVAGDSNRAARRLLLRCEEAASLLVCLWCASAAWAQPELEEDAAIEEQDRLPAAVRLAVRQADLPLGLFDQWVFQGENEQSVRERLQSNLSQRIEEIDRLTPLTSPQIEKFRLAGRTDVKRIFDRIDAGRRAFDIERRSPQHRAGLHQSVQPFIKLLAADAFGRGSLFDKSSQTLLAPEQLSRYQRHVQERCEARQLKLREMIVETIDEQHPLDAEQKAKLRALLAECPQVNAGPYESQAIWCAAGRLPARRYRAVLNREQWEYLQAWIANFQPKERIFEQHGAFADDLDDAAF